MKKQSKTVQSLVASAAIAIEHYDEDDLEEFGEEEFADPTLQIRPVSLHVWRYTADRDPRPDGMILEGGSP